jgi:hypothetical protein
MEQEHRTPSFGSSTFKYRNGSVETGGSGRPSPQRSAAKKGADSYTTKNSLIIGAKTLAGVGLGLLAVSGGFLLVGAFAEAAVVPSLLLKLAGGLTGGGLGMAKGLKDAGEGEGEGEEE